MKHARYPAALAVAVILGVAGCASSSSGGPSTPRTVQQPPAEQVQTYEVPQYELDFLDQIAMGFATSAIAGDAQSRSAAVEYAYELCPFIREHGSAAVGQALAEEWRVTPNRTFNGEMPGLMSRAAETYLC